MCLTITLLLIASIPEDCLYRFLCECNKPILLQEGLHSVWMSVDGVWVSVTGVWGWCVVGVCKWWVDCVWWVCVDSMCVGVCGWVWMWGGGMGHEKHSPRVTQICQAIIMSICGIFLTLR